MVYSDYSKFPQELYRKRINGGPEEILLRAGFNTTPSDISADGKWLVYSTTEPKTVDDLWLLPLVGEAKPVKYLDSMSNEMQGQFSPDGKWMAYSSDETGQFQIMVQPIPATSFKRQVSAHGGTRPRWRREGKELFYISAESRLMAVPAKLSPAGFDFGAPHELFARPLPILDAIKLRDFWYQPTSDGQRFLTILSNEGTASGVAPIAVQLNWQAGLSSKN